MSDETAEHRIGRVLRISSGESRSCPVCGSWLEGSDWDDSVNHVIREHGWRLLHVGGEWAEDGEGKSIQLTVAVLGEEDRQAF